MTIMLIGFSIDTVSGKKEFLVGMRGVVLDSEVLLLKDRDSVFLNNLKMFLQNLRKWGLKTVVLVSSVDRDELRSFLDESFLSPLIDDIISVDFFSKLVSGTREFIYIGTRDVRLREMKRDGFQVIALSRDRGNDHSFLSTGIRTVIRDFSRISLLEIII